MRENGSSTRLAAPNSLPSHRNERGVFFPRGNLFIGEKQNQRVETTFGGDSNGETHPICKHPVYALSWRRVYGIIVILFIVYIYMRVIGPAETVSLRPDEATTPHGGPAEFISGPPPAIYTFQQRPPFGRGRVLRPARRVGPCMCVEKKTVCGGGIGRPQSFPDEFANNSQLRSK